MKRLLLGLALAAALLTVSGCAERPDVEQTVQRALDWLAGVTTGNAEPTPTLIPTPTLAPRATTVQTAPGAPPAATPGVPAAPGPFEGAFVGTVQSDSNTSARIGLELTQRGDQVAGTVALGEGLVVNAGGFCGSVAVPATAFTFQETVPISGRQVATTTTINAAGFDLEVALSAAISADGQTLTAEATIFTPAICPRDPVLSGTATRQ
jgi:hypothetical protein